MPQNHSKIARINDKIYQLSAGYSGEVETDQILPEIGLHNDCSIIKGLRLEVFPGNYIQIDTLLITRKCMILLEIKKYGETVEFDETSGKTTITSSSGEVNKFDCVVHQVDRAVHGLKTFFRERQIPLPIFPIIVMANQKVEISQYPITTPVKYKKQLPRYIRELLRSKDIISQQEMDQIANFIKARHAIRKYVPACERNEIATSEILTGVLCPSCGGIMRRSQGRTWTCENCLSTSPTAVAQAVTDWFYLISSTINNKQLRYFLDIHSKNAASKILSDLQLTRIGMSSNTTYTWNYEKPLGK